MLQAPVCDGCTLAAFTLDEDCFGPAEVDVGRGEIVEADVCRMAPAADAAGNASGSTLGPRAKHIMDCGEPMPNDVGSVVANRIGASDTANGFMQP